MKILIISEWCNPVTQGGVQSFGRALKKMFKKEISFISYDVNPEDKIYTVEDNFEIKRFNLLEKIVNKITFGFLRNEILKKRIIEIRPNVCILRSPQNLKLLDKIECEKILVQHTKLDLYFNDSDYFNKELKLVEDAKIKLKYFVVTSEKDKELLEKKYNFPKEKIKLIRHSSMIELKKTHKIKNKNLIIISRLDNNSKRIDLAIESMSKLNDFNLKIYGAGPDKKYLENLIKENKLKNVYLCGQTNSVKEKLDEAGIFIMTSDFEGYPITTIEAMRRGLPIVMRDTFEGASDIVKNNVNGILLGKVWNEEEFCNAIRKVYENYEEFSKKSIKLGNRYNLELIKGEWEKLIRD